MDYMIGLDQSEWQPQRIIKADKGGDFWIWANEFGRCIAGRHPWIAEVPYKNSQAMFSVLNTLYQSELRHWKPKDSASGKRKTKSKGIAAVNAKDGPMDRRWETRKLLTGRAKNAAAGYFAEARRNSQRALSHTEWSRMIDDKHRSEDVGKRRMVRND